MQLALRSTTLFVNWVRLFPVRFVFLLCIGILMVTVRGGFLLTGFDLGSIKNLMDQHPVITPVAFVGVHAILVMCMLPTLPLNLGAGFLWGVLYGGLFAVAGGTLGAIGSFLLARKVFGQPLRQRFESPLLTWMQNKLQKHGWKIIAFVRLNPAFPGPINFVFGLTSIDFIAYCWTTLVFLVPPAFFFAYVGSTMQQAVIGSNNPEIISDIIVISFVLTFLTGLSLWMKRHLTLDRDS
jgi:uncharacterized membrane protein YdjX (TVP38/TMEM64 family)